ncbi:MAG: lipocalin-like domain-containing protein [Bacteroidaceae bacterium]|nr:lipocalin-like domain-containing protein [Bacteroidaceae bacterium]
MKRILFFMTVSLLLLSCERIYINGELDGMWKLHSVESSDTVAYPGNIYYSFQRHLVMLSEHFESGFPNYYVAEFDKRGDSLTMSKFYKWPVSEGICDRKELEKYFIFGDTVKFGVEVLNSDILIMHDGERRFNFRKW